jgi:hypothetical protein
LLFDTLCADARNTRERRQLFVGGGKRYPVCRVERSNEAENGNPSGGRFDEPVFRAECFDFGLRAYWRCAVFWRFCPSCSEFLTEPLENGVLFIQPGASDLREQPNRTGFLMRYVLCALIARGAQSTEIGQFFLAAEALIYDVPDVKSNFTACCWVDLARGQAAHLARKSVAVQNRGP